MTTEEDLLGEAYFKEYGGDLEDLDADAEEALLRGSDDENEYVASRKEVKPEEESVEYVDEEGNPVEVSESNEVQFVEYSASVQDDVSFESGTIEEGGDVLELVVDADLEFDDSVVQENVSAEEHAKRGEPEEIITSSRTTNRRRLQMGKVDKDEEKQQHNPESIELTKREDEYYHEQPEETSARIESSDSEDEEERIGRGRFHSERPNCIQLTTSKKRTNIPDTLDVVFQNINDANRSDYGRDRRNNSSGRYNSRLERKDRDRDRGSTESNRLPSLLSSVSRAELTIHHSQRAEAPSHAESKPPVSLLGDQLVSDSQNAKVDSRGPRKILINPHFKGSSSRSSSWLGDTPPRNDYVRETVSSNVPDVSLPQQHQLAPNTNTLQSTSNHHPNQGQHISDQRPPPYSYEHVQPPLAQPNNYPTSFSTPAPPQLSTYQSVLPLPSPLSSVPAISNRQPASIVHNTMGPPPNVYNQRGDVMTHLPVSQGQSWLQGGVPHPTMGQPVQMQEIQNCSQWPSSHPSISHMNAPLNRLPPNHSTHTQRWPHSAPLSFHSHSGPQTSVVPAPPPPPHLPFVDGRLALLPDLHRPPPSHLSQIPPSFGAPPPVYHLDTPPPVTRNMWQNQPPNRLPAKQAINSVRPPLFDHPPPLLLGSMLTKYQPASIGAQMQRERQPVPSQYNMINTNLLNVPTQMHPPRPRLPHSGQNVIRSGLQPNQWVSTMIRHRMPNSPNQFHAKRPMAHENVSPQKVLKTYDKQIAWRNTNIKEVQLVENLPSAAEFEASNSSKPPDKLPSDPAVMEDEETRRYRAQIELQKKKREQIVKMKEIRRQQMAMERRKELIDRQKLDKQNEQQQHVPAANAIVPVNAFPSAALAVPKTASQKPHVGSGSFQQQCVPQTPAGIQKRVVMVRKIPALLGNQTNAPQVQVGQNAIGNVRIGKPKPQVQIVSPQIVAKPVNQAFKRSAVPQPGGAKEVQGAKAECSIPPKRMAVVPKPGGMTVVKRVQPMQGMNTGKQIVAQRRTVIGNKQVLLANPPPQQQQQQRTVVINSNVDGQASRFLQQRKAIPSGNQQTQRQVVTGPASVLIENLALATNEAHVHKLCQSVGHVETVEVFREQRKAIVTFQSQQHACIFMEKYQRRMVDLSLISISLIG